ncbi:arylsulfatase B-like isoform X2 [Amphiura filiformis]|uniref:arylsulfatase B-like isoform X2 n=1 Tax=Amphiura filiformis TaxID=82378 RepID=UPI003B224C8D
MYVQPIYTPTRSQLMSGRYQIYTGLQHEIINTPQPHCLPVSLPTLPEKLKQAGYSTHMVGKWHLGFYKKDCLPTRRGFDSYFGYLSGSENYYTHTRSGSMAGFSPGKEWNALDLRDGEKKATNYSGKYSTHVFTERVQEVIEQHDLSKPMFLYLAFQAVHSPLQVPKRYMDPYNKTIKHKTRKTFAGMVSCMDEGIGNITQTLHDTGMWNNTVIVFSTDNGGPINVGANNWPLRGEKHSVWEGGVRGVGFVTGPVLSDDVRGTVNKEMIHVSDWFPTLVTGVAGMDLTGTKLDGFNVWDAIASKDTLSPRKEILHDIDPFYGRTIFTNESGIPCTDYNTSMHAAIRYGDWKLITGDPGFDRGCGWKPAPDSGINPPSIPVKPLNDTIWLFNITADPNEYNDLSKKHPEVVEELVSKLKAYQKTAVPVVWPAGDLKANPKLGDGAWGPWA